ncbi:MAG: dockerin type I domain-containing protein [Ruminococcus sp.]|nr:dockerin type I domain-containing protein [Ruminococcus sp.]
MKKAVLFICSLAVLMSTAVSAVSAEETLDEKTYIPQIYFKANPSETADILPTGTVYFNTKADGELKSQTGVYIKDELVRSGQIFLKWEWYDDNVYLANLNNPFENGTIPPYNEFSSSIDIGKNYTPESKLMGISYGNIGTYEMLPLSLTGEKSDSYALAYFDINVADETPSDYYEIAFRTQQPNVSNIAYRLSDKSLRDLRPSGENAQPLTIAVSDRMLGDVNDDGIIDATDASAVLSEYALSSVNGDGEFTKAQLISADVNGDKVVDATDASSLLSYYAYTSVSDSIPLTEFMSR